MCETRRIDYGGGHVAYRGPTFEWRVALLIEMADRMRNHHILKLTNIGIERLFKEWKTESADISDGANLLRVFDRATWSPLSSMRDFRDRVRDKLIEDAENVCGSEELKELISVMNVDGDWDTDAHASLRSAYHEYRRNYLCDDLRECDSTEQFEALLEDLEFFHQSIGLDTLQEVKRVHAALSEFEGERHPENPYEEDYVMERRGEERSTDEGLREMFGSLTSDRK